ncbi:MAG: pyridoxal phosphate-dependent aminotransferase [Smithellaceae bacterium]|nr:pyridoxal phosphate-dependent aminotransferase [Smithellaceae bacterium]
MKLAKRIGMIKPSPTLAITAKAESLRAEGRDIIGFGAGEPDFDTPANVKAAAVKAIDQGFTKYTPVGGTNDLKDAIIGKLERDNGLAYKRNQIVVSCGAKHTLYNLAQVLFEEGDEVIIPAPYWVSYPDIVILTGAKPVIVETKEEDGFKLRPEALKAAITKKTKAVVINSPSNPTGAAYTKAELDKLAEIIVPAGIIAISDDIYEKIIYDGFSFADIAQASEEMKKLTVVVNGVSKAYAMTGWRIGYAAGPEEIIAAISKIQSQNTSNPTSIAQKAAEEALKGDQQIVSVMVAEFNKRRNFIAAALNAMPGVSCLNPQGAFYVFPNVSGLFGKSFGGKVIRGSGDLAGFLLEEANIAVVAGEAFGSDRHIRLSYATSMAKIEEGMKRMTAALSKLA